MKRSLWSLVVAVVVLAVGGATPGCSCNHNGVGNGDGGAGGGGTGGGGGGGTTADPCGDNDPSCVAACIGPTCMPPKTFPLPGDVPPDPDVGADGVDRDPNGWIVLNQGKSSFNYIWIADDQAYGVGMVSKIDTRKSTAAGGAVNHDYREVARYLTVTCDSNEPASRLSHAGQIVGGPSGIPTATNCDGTNGCCSRGPTGGGRTPIQLVNNHPSRTAVDFNGDAWVSNRAHIEQPHQSSVSKIANKNNSATDTDCVERNGQAGIQTSFDANGDGIINTDCNGNGVPDNITDVTATACKANTPQEFWGLDDECILFTTNTGAVNGVGRPLALGQGSTDFAPSDAWAGRYTDSVWYRVDGTTGLIKTTVKVNDQAGVVSHPYGAAIDQAGILWAPNIDGHYLFYFDTNNPTTNQAMVAPPAAPGNGFYGVAIDGYKAIPPGGTTPQLVQQIWLANYGAVGGFRYTPKRSALFSDAGLGTWTQFTFAGATGNGRGVGVDNRSPTSFAWFALDGGNTVGAGNVGRVAVDYMLGTPVVMVASGAFATSKTTTLGAGVAADSDVWAISQIDHAATHFKVDATGNVTLPGAGDQVNLDDNNLTAGAVAHTPPYPYTYSDFTGFGLRNFTNPHGSYSNIWTGCGPGKTKWLKVTWDAATPGGTGISVKVRSSDDKATLTSAPFTGNYTSSPADLQNAPGPVTPNPSGFLQVEFDLTTTDKNSTPALKSYTVIYECVNGIG
ncbi:MAG: Tryptophan synthase alpha chain [Myxococcales bacterium]|nr:Tryptophan synthase alpha chain [Myxococcales bacterium]